MEDLQTKKKEIVDLNRTKRKFRNDLLEALEKQGLKSMTVGSYIVEIEDKPSTQLSLVQLREHPQIDGDTYKIVCDIASKNVIRKLKVRKIRQKKTKGDN